jgi:Uma2 family endonuclease
VQGHWSEHDFLLLENFAENRMLELNDGSLELLPMPDIRHQAIVKFLFQILDAFVTQARLGHVYFAPLPIRLWENQLREPDVVFLKANRIKDRSQPPEGADLVVEVVSPGQDNRERDLKTKRTVYARAKIPEYWIVDPQEKTITVLVLVGKTYRVHGSHRSGERAASKLLNGFEVNVRDVFAAADAF